jgi:hypothetical protein
VAVILANSVEEGDSLLPYGLWDPTITIPTVLIGYSTDQAIRSQLADGVNVTLDVSTNNNMDVTHRWLMGEEDLAYGRVEAFRDMWRPECYSHPGKTSDGLYYCGYFDNGGVHFNSGIPNHAYALLVDGGTYNGQTIRGIGLTKAAHIYFRAMTVYHVPASDFADHAEALEAAADDLIGRKLPDLLTGEKSGERITRADAEQVHKATLVVELRDPPAHCNFQPLLAKDPPADSCPLPNSPQQTIFSDDFELNPLPRWTVSREVGDPSAFIPRDWEWVHALPNSRSGSGFFALEPFDDCTSPSTGQVGVLKLASPAITVPAAVSSQLHLAFDHWVAVEEGYDGAQLMISVNGAPFQLVTSSAFIYNGYNQSLFPAIPGFEIYFNPRAGQPAFTGTDGGSLKGSWGTSIVDLSSYAQGGDTIQLRWDLSTDYCFGTNLGWYLDDVRVYACASQPLNRNECKNGLWRRFDTPRAFRHQGDCIQFVLTGE